MFASNQSRLTPFCLIAWFLLAGLKGFYNFTENVSCFPVFCVIISCRALWSQLNNSLCVLTTLCPAYICFSADLLSVSICPANPSRSPAFLSVGSFNSSLRKWISETWWRLSEICSQASATLCVLSERLKPQYVPISQAQPQADSHMRRICEMLRIGWQDLDSSQSHTHRHVFLSLGGQLIDIMHSLAPYPNPNHHNYFAYP